jgi:hypothetical protein
MTNVVDKPAENAARPTGQSAESHHPLASLRSPYPRPKPPPNRPGRSKLTEPSLGSSGPVLVEPIPPTVLHRRRRPLYKERSGREEQWPGLSARR